MSNCIVKVATGSGVIDETENIEIAIGQVGGPFEYGKQCSAPELIQRYLEELAEHAQPAVKRIVEDCSPDIRTDTKCDCVDGPSH